MSYTVSAADVKHLRLFETDETAAILQNVAVILFTRRGTVPLYRDFGLPQNFLDKPITAARSLLHAEIKEAVEAFEPRVEVLGVTFREDAEVPGGLIPRVEVKLRQ